MCSGSDHGLIGPVESAHQRVMLNMDAADVVVVAAAAAAAVSIEVE